MKADPNWGEIVSLKRLGVPVRQCGLDHWVFKGEVSPDDLAAAAAGFQTARELVLSGDYDLVVLDELVHGAVLRALSAGRRAGAAGGQARRRGAGGHRAARPAGARRRRPTWSRRCAPLKHYYDAGVQARARHRILKS